MPRRSISFVVLLSSLIVGCSARLSVGAKTNKGAPEPATEVPATEENQGETDSGEVPASPQPGPAPQPGPTPQPAPGPQSPDTPPEPSIADFLGKARSSSLLKPFVSVAPYEAATRPVWTWTSGGDGSKKYIVALNQTADAASMSFSTDASFQPATDLPEGRHRLYVAEIDVDGALTEWAEAATVIIGPLALANSSISLGKTAIEAVGSDNVSVSVRLRDFENVPVVGVTPQLTATGKSISLIQNCTPTDVNGDSVCAGAVSSGSIGTASVGLGGLFPLNTPLQVADARYGPSPNACGLNRDGDGIPGEPEDCNVCDGTAGAEADEIYVDAANGDDMTGTGTALLPYKTIAKALTAADGNGDGVGDTFCLAGTFNESVALLAANSGVIGAFQALHGSLVPSNPVAFIGWDKDNDGHYPPFDADDIAVIDGENTRAWAFDNSTAGAEFIEIAHLTIRNFTHQGTTSGVFNNNHASTRRFFYFHDLYVQNINPNRAFSVNNVLIKGSDNGSNENYVIYNNHFEDVGGGYVYFASSTSLHTSNSLIRNNRFDLKLLPGQLYEGIYIKAHRNIVVEQNLFNTRASLVAIAGRGDLTIRACSRDITVRQNFMKETHVGVFIRPDGDCGAAQATINNIVIERNLMEGGGASADLVSIRDHVNTLVTDETNSVENVDIFSNYFYSMAAASTDGAVWMFTGHTNTGTQHPARFRIYGNTFRGVMNKVIIAAKPAAATEAPRHIDIRNNLFDVTNLDTQGAVQIGHAPAQFESRGNVFNLSEMDFRWNSTLYNNDFATWAAATTGSHVGDTTSCVPAFDAVNHLTHFGAASPRVSALSCSVSGGDDISAVVPTDFEGHSRVGGTAVGADVFPP